MSRSTPISIHSIILYRYYQVHEEISLLEYSSYVMISDWPDFIYGPKVGCSRYRLNIFAFVLRYISKSWL